MSRLYHVSSAAVVAILVSLLVTSFGRAQEPHRMGIDATRLRAGHDSMAVYLIRGNDTIRTGIIRETLEFVAEDGTRRVRRIYRSSDQVLGSRVDTLVDNSPDLTAVLQHSHTDRGTETIDYGSKHARGWMRLANGDSVSVEAPLPDLVYSASSFDLVVRAAPLGEAWRAEVPSFLPSTRTVVPLRARVVRAERIGPELCWRVDADFAGSAVSFWVGQTSRRLCQQVMHNRPGVQVLFGSFQTAAVPQLPRA